MALSLASVLTVFGLEMSQAIAAPMCNTEMTEIATQMIEDLPSYGNRVIQRARKLDRVEDLYSYILITALPEFQPLPLTNHQYQPTVADTTEQIFFTALSKQYIDDLPVTYENYYWVLVTRTNYGWEVVHVLSSVGDARFTGILPPPLDSTRGVVGQATKLWFRDYNAKCVN
ncbi:MAG: hypothetical protein WBB82_04300 [Limnothrix sp.]